MFCLYDVKTLYRYYDQLDAQKQDLHMHAEEAHRHSTNTAGGHSGSSSSGNGFSGNGFSGTGFSGNGFTPGHPHTGHHHDPNSDDGHRTMRHSDRPESLIRAKYDSRHGAAVGQRVQASRGCGGALCSLQ